MEQRLRFYVLKTENGVPGEKRIEKVKNTVFVSGR